jgi:hypothetical protein
VTEVDATTILFVVASVGSMLLIIGELAQEMGRSQVRWVWTGHSPAVYRRRNVRLEKNDEGPEALEPPGDVIGAAAMGVAR